MRTILLSFLLFFTLISSAQSAKEKGLNSINRETAEVHINFLASDVLEGREAGKRGSKIASEYIKAILKETGISPLNESFFQPFEAYSRERQKRVRFSVHPDSIAKYKRDPAHRKLDMRNVLGYIEGENKDEFVVIGAHFDHLGTDETLGGDKIYNGADDNASGVSASLQIAKAFVRSGTKPKRSIIFAFWDGEELGLLGSEYFMLNFPDPSKIKGYLNFDMIGRNNDETKPNHVVYFYTESHPAFGQWIKDHINDYKIELEPAYRPWNNPIGGSDNASFAKRGIPIIWYHTDGHIDYHQPSDHSDKINWNKVVNITKAAYLNLWNLANTEDY